MPFPIKFKLIRKDTGESFKDWSIRTRASTGCTFKLMPVLNNDGAPGYISYESHYLAHHFLKPGDWDILVATSKDAKGNWSYEPLEN